MATCSEPAKGRKRTSSCAFAAFSRCLEPGHSRPTGAGYRVEAEAALARQTATEDIMEQVFRDSVCLARHARRSTLVSMRANFGDPLLRLEPGNWLKTGGGPVFEPNHENKTPVDSEASCVVFCRRFSPVSEQVPEQVPEQIFQTKLRSSGRKFLSRFRRLQEVAKQVRRRYQSVGAASCKVQSALQI